MQIMKNARPLYCDRANSRGRLRLRVLRGFRFVSGSDAERLPYRTARFAKFDAAYGRTLLKRGSDGEARPR